MIYLKTKWNANARGENKGTSKEANGSLSANPTSIDTEASRGGTLDTKMELIANVSGDGAHRRNVSSRRTVEAHEGLDLLLTFVTESYPPVSSQHWTKPTTVNNNHNVTMYQESSSAQDHRSEETSCLSSDLVKMQLKAPGGVTPSTIFGLQACVLRYRSEASLMLRRVRQEDRGTYTFHSSNSFFLGFQTIDLQIYRKRRASYP